MTKKVSGNFLGLNRQFLDILGQNIGF